jgi:hypothetical protein
MSGSRFSGFSLIEDLQFKVVGSFVEVSSVDAELSGGKVPASLDAERTPLFVVFTVEESEDRVREGVSGAGFPGSHLHSNGFYRLMRVGTDLDAIGVHRNSGLRGFRRESLPIHRGPFRGRRIGSCGIPVAEPCLVDS